MLRSGLKSHGTQSGRKFSGVRPLTVKLLKNGVLKTYKDTPHGVCQTHPDLVNADLLAFVREGKDMADRAQPSAPPLHA